MKRRLRRFVGSILEIIGLLCLIPGTLLLYLADRLRRKEDVILSPESTHRRLFSEDARNQALWP